MRPVATEGVACMVCLSVGHIATTVSPTKTAELIEMSFVTWTRVDQWNHVLDGV